MGGSHTEFKARDWRAYTHPIVFFSNGQGDHLLVLPALRALGSLFSGRLALICGIGSHKRYFSDVALRRVIEVGFRNDEGGREFDALALADKVGQCDLFISLVPWENGSLSQLLSYLKPAFSVGFTDEFSATAPAKSAHAADKAFEIAQYFCPAIKFTDYCFHPNLPTEPLTVASQFRALFPTSAKLLAVHTETDVRKTWTADYFREALDLFLRDYTDFFAVVVDKDTTEVDRGQYGDRVIMLARQPIDVAFAIVAQADYFLGIDSCMLHVADLCGVPGVGLFGPTSSAEFGFRVAPHIHVSGSGSLRQIEPAKIDQALRTLVLSAPTKARFEHQMPAPVRG